MSDTDKLVIASDERTRLEELRALEYRIEYKTAHADEIKMRVFEEILRDADRAFVSQVTDRLIAMGNQMAIDAWEKRERAKADARARREARKVAKATDDADAFDGAEGAGDVDVTEGPSDQY